MDRSSAEGGGRGVASGLRLEGRVMLGGDSGLNTDPITGTRECAHSVVNRVRVRVRLSRG